MNDDEPREPNRIRGCFFWCLMAPILYVLSSGPVLALGFWLREATGRDGFYSVMFLYYPIIVLGHGNPIDSYIDWWVAAFDTVGPG